MAADVPTTSETGGVGKSLDSLSFLDLLYAVPVGDLAVRVSSSDLGRVTAAEWGNLAVCMTMIILSWIGLHQNRTAMAQEADHRQWIGEANFLSLRFAQFMVEVILIGMYFALGLQIQLPKTAITPDVPPSMTWIAGFVLIIFISYFVWDVLDIVLAPNHTTWQRQAFTGGIVTLIFSLIFGACYVLIDSNRNTIHSALYWSLAIVFLLYLYRVVQEKAKG